MQGDAESPEFLPAKFEEIRYLVRSITIFFDDIIIYTLRHQPDYITLLASASG